MEPRPLMQCGHTAQGKRESDGAPVCVICYGLNPGYDKPVEEDQKPDLTGRLAKCSYKVGDTRGRYPVNMEAHTTGVPSGTQLPFFAYKPNEEFDQFYCGCWGWD